MLWPFMPSVAAEIRKQLGFTDASDPAQWVKRADAGWGRMPAGQRVGEHPVLFPRTDAKPVD
jgi:methionyl-tRNA synthetase